MGKDWGTHQLVKGNRGGVVGSLLFWILFLGLIGYGGYLFGFPYYSYSMVNHQAHSVVTFQGLTDEDILNKIKAEARAQSIELGRENIELTRVPHPDRPGEGHPRLVISWEHDVEAYGYYLTTLYFYVDTSD